MIVHIGHTLELAVPLVNGAGGFDVSAPDPAWRGETSAARHLGAYVTKSVTRHARDGNPEPRVALWGEPAATGAGGYGLVNAAGIPNPGIEHALGRWRNDLEALGLPTVLSLSGDAAELEEMVAIIESGPHERLVAAYELNLSCPNLGGHGALLGSDPTTAAECVRAARTQTDRAVIAKLTPACGDLGGVAAACEAAGADAITAVNTMPVRAIDPAGRDLLGTATGGLSGTPLHAMALAAVARVAGVVDIPVIGLGGVDSEAAAGRMLDAGASIVGVATAAMIDPPLLARLAHTLAHGGVTAATTTA